MNKFYDQRLKIGKKLEETFKKLFEYLDFTVILTDSMKDSFESQMLSTFKSDQIKKSNPILMLRWLPDFLVLILNSNSRFMDAFYVDIKAMYTPVFLPSLPKQLEKAHGKKFLIENIGNIEREAYKSYMSHYKSGSKVFLIIACSNNPNLILCDYIENIEVLHKDERERNMQSSGSTTPRVNINLEKMIPIKEFFKDNFNKPFSEDLNQRLLSSVRSDLSFIGKPRMINKKTAEEVRDYLSKKNNFQLHLKDI